MADVRKGTMLRSETKYKRPGSCRSGVSLIEATMALTLTAMLMIPVTGLLQTSRDLWEQADSDRVRMNSVYGTLRHLSRKLRTAETILALESRRGKPTILQIRTIDGQVLSWTHDARSGRVIYQSGGDAGVLADNIHQLQFDGLTAAGKRTTDLKKVRTIRCTASTDTKRKNNAISSSECTVWIRPEIGT